MVMKNIEKRIFAINSNAEFEKIALEVFHIQKERCTVYAQYVNSLNRKDPSIIQEIPFLPISFFKTHEVKTINLPIEFEFLSSATTGLQRSRHLVQNKRMYESSFEIIYRNFIGNPEDQVILALLPNYLEQGNSSLVYMVEKLIQLSKNSLSGFFLNDYSKLIESYKIAVKNNKKVIVFGVSYALLDLAEMNIDFSKAKVIETGGMKGRRKEMTKDELHLKLTEGLRLDAISSEYGMTELFSQSYSDKNGLFEMPPWMQILIRETNDPFHYVEDGKTGGINIIDLANLYSCSFIETQDLGQRLGNDFKLMGRFDNSDIRGCNLMVE